MNKESVKECLAELGYQYKEYPEYDGLFTKVKGVGIVYENQDEDNQEYFRLIAPYVFEIKDETQTPFLLDVVNDVNVRLRYVKAEMNDDEVRIVFEYRIFSEDHALKLVHFGLRILSQAVNYFHELLKKGNSQEED